LCVDGNTALIGAFSDADSGSNTGAAYIFSRAGSTWTQTGKALAGDGKSGDLLGSSLALSDSSALVAALRTDGACPTNPDCDSGSVYVFQLAPTARQYGSCATGSPCTNPDDHGGCRNSTGQGAVLAAAGSGSVSNDDLYFEVTRVPPNKLTLFFMGPAQTSAQFGDGIRFASPQPPVGIYRYGGAAADAQGRGVRGPGLVAQGQRFPAAGRILAGQTWNFQMWYRDIQGPCHGLTNFSNAVEVGFGP
jgi:hypothetical protein